MTGKCKICNNLKNDWCEKVIDSPDPDMVRDCRFFSQKTNADRYRAMSDEELARTFAQTGNCPPSPEYGHNCERCSKCWLDYLRQSVKEGEGE